MKLRAQFDLIVVCFQGLIDALSSLFFFIWTIEQLWNGVIYFYLFYFQVFREHQIDGSTLALLSEDHLTQRLGMKLGPALKLRSLALKKLGPAFSELCVHCANCHERLRKSKAESNRPESRGSAASKE